MEQIQCKRCEKGFTSLWGLSKHNSQKHSMSSEVTYINYNLDGVEPTCECGCGDKPTFLSIKKGYNKFIKGHASRINNNWGHNPNALKKSHTTQKLMHESGELKVWNDGLTIDDPRVRDNISKMISNPNRGKNISKALLDVPKSKKHKEKLSDTAKVRWSDPKEREAQRFRRLGYFRTSQSRKRSKLEQFFEDVLVNMNIDFEPSYSVNGYLYDFYIKQHNILIEVDGDWHHFNDKVHSLPLSAIQKNTIQNDKKKNKVAKDNNITLIRFWEYDIKNNLDEVIIKLKELL